MLASQMQSRCYLIDTVEDPLAVTLLAVELDCQRRKVDARRWLSGDELHPAFIAVLKFSMLTLAQQDPRASGHIVDRQRMAQTPLREGKTCECDPRQGVPALEQGRDPDRVALQS